MDVEKYGDMVQREKEQAERILNEFLTSAAEIKKICLAHDECSSQCPYFYKGTGECILDPYEIETGLIPVEWNIEE